MNVTNRVCQQCGTPLAPNQAFCGNCGKSAGKPVTPPGEERTVLASPSVPYSPSFSNGSNSVPVEYQSQSPTPPPMNGGYTPVSAPVERAMPGGYGQQPYGQMGGFAPTPQPQPKRGPKIGILLGIVALLVVLVAVSLGAFLLTRGGKGKTIISPSASPTVPHLNITPYTYRGYPAEV